MSATVPATSKLGGRPSKFTSEVRSRLIELIGKGVPHLHACRAVRISYQSFRNYVAQDETFSSEIEAAVAAGIEKRLDVILKSADLGDTASARWWLEHVFPESFSRSRLEVTGLEGGPLDARVIVLTWPHEKTVQQKDNINEEDTDRHLADASSDAD